MELTQFFPNNKKYCALVTGGSRGLGKTICDALTSLGVEVLAPSREQVDLSNVSSIESFVKNTDFSKINILINNAGINFPDVVDQITVQNWMSTINVNLTSAFLLSQKFAQEQKSGWGRIVNISSVLSKISKPGRAAYTSSKAGVDGLTRSLAIELGPKNILVNSICPGYINSELTRQNNSPEQIQKICSQIPLQRMAEFEEIVKLVVFLSSNMNTYITGQNIIIDGGVSII